MKHSGRTEEPSPAAGQEPPEMGEAGRNTHTTRTKLAATCQPWLVRLKC